MKGRKEFDTGPEEERRREDPARLNLERCGNSHAFFFSYESCPLCGGELESFTSPPEAELISHTVVRVSPTGSPFALGLARVASGAQTLCIIEGGIDQDPGKHVVIMKRGGLYHAVPRRIDV